MLFARHLALSGIRNGGPLARAQPNSPYPFVRPRTYSTPTASAQQTEPICDNGEKITARRVFVPGWKTTRRSHRPISPSDVLAEYISSRTSGKQKEELWPKIMTMARDRSTRLPVMTAQMMWYRDESLRLRGLTDELLPRGRNWSKRLRATRNTGVTKRHLVTWSWILRGNTADARLERFLESTTLHRPIFLLFLMVRSDHIFHDRQLFSALLEHVSETYTRVPMGEDGRPVARGEYRALDNVLNMTPTLFVQLLGRLQFHASRLYPETVIRLAEITTSYMQLRAALEKPESNSGPGYAARCWVLNSTLRILSKPATSRPFANMELNWDALKHLLAFSSSLERPLIINKTGYQAIQSVMIGREKSPGEEKVAIRSTKTWPPYRRAWDGIDEQRRPEDDLSRAVKAGIQAREAGYPETQLDRALAALGGAVLGQSPTVQTRSLAPVAGKGEHASNPVHALWAARIKATRNAQEAWEIFRSPPHRNVKPSSAVYGAMMAKLVAGEVPDPSSAVPGNQRENFPIYQSPNLTELEKARIRPPTLEQLTRKMLDSGMKLFGHPLLLVIMHSNSEAEALHWLGLSPYSRFGDEVLEKVPRSVFNAYIYLLCKLQRKEDAAAATQTWSKPPDHYLELAVQITAARLKPDTQEGRTYKPPWLQILQTAIMAKTHTSLRYPAIRRARLVTFIKVFPRVVMQTGIDSELLSLLSLSAGRVLTAAFTSTNYDRFSERTNEAGAPAASDTWWVEARHAHIDKITKDLFQALRRELLDSFAEMKRSGSGIDGFHVYSFVRTMALFGDVDAMAVALDWALSQLEDGSTLGGAATAGSLSSYYLNLGLALFETIAPGKMDSCLIQSVKTRRQALLDKGYPVGVPELAQSYLDDVALVSVVARGWASTFDARE